MNDYETWFEQVAGTKPHPWQAALAHDHECPLQHRWEPRELEATLFRGPVWSAATTISEAEMRTAFVSTPARSKESVFDRSCAAIVARPRRLAITLLLQAPRSRKFGNDALNAGHIAEEKNRCR